MDHDSHDGARNKPYSYVRRSLYQLTFEKEGKCKQSKHHFASEQQRFERIEIIV